MKILLFISLLFIIGCSSHQKEVPSWVNGIRSGEETHKVALGSKILFRRIAGSDSKDRETACEEAISKVEKDLNNHYPHFINIPYALEVLFYDDNYEDCAVTISVSSALHNKYEELKAIKEKFDLKESELEKEIAKAKDENVVVQKKYNELAAFVRKNAHILVQVNKMETNIDKIRAMIVGQQEKAEAYAFTGLHFEHFQDYMKERLQKPNTYGAHKQLCWSNFKHLSSTDHGSIVICWSINKIILGYCKVREGNCYSKWP